MVVARLAVPDPLRQRTCRHGLHGDFLHGQALQHEVAERHGHGRPGVQLQADRPLPACLGRVVDELDGKDAIHLVLQPVAARDDAHAVPRSEVDRLRTCEPAELPHRPVGRAGDLLPVLREDAAASFLVQHAEVGRLTVHVALVAVQCVLATLDHPGAILHA